MTLAIGATAATAPYAIAGAAGNALEHSCAAFAPKQIINEAVLTEVRFEIGNDARAEACVVRGRIASSPTSTINFRLDLPDTRTWNARLLFIGGGGFDGVVPTDIPDWMALYLGRSEPLPPYAVVSTDSGHQARGAFPMGDFSWVVNNRAALLNHGHEANHVVLGVAVNLVEAFYGHAPSRRYLAGSSNGGRAGLMAAQRYPKDYDGILAMEPAIAQEGFAANLTPLFQHIFSSPENWLSREQIKLFEDAQLAACDAHDGLEDGILGNEAACQYDPADLQCRSTERSSHTCLMPGQIASIRKILADKRVDVPLADSAVGYPAHGRSAPSADWSSFIFGSSFAARDAINYIFADNIIKHGITNDPNASVMTHEPERWAKEYLALSNEIDATNPDLSAFNARGGKLIVWHGTADGCVTHERTAEYVEAVEAATGRRAARGFLRFFVSPGIGHSRSGPGVHPDGLIEALDQWVSKGRPPDHLTATKRDQSGNVLFTRPVCEHRKFPRFTGRGDANTASAFVCTQES